uniref:Uncharacterized protein n=1 Tax=Romanomermis culicivorax TaxID=13658 RepID=A0A915K7J0_ROMCU
MLNIGRFGWLRECCVLRVPYPRMDEANGSVIGLDQARWVVQSVSFVEEQGNMGSLDSIDTTPSSSAQILATHQKLGKCGSNCKFVPARGMVPSTGWIVITDFGCEGMVAIVVNMGVLIAGIGETVVEETNLKAMVGNDIIVMVVIAYFGIVGPTSIGPAGGNGTLISGYVLGFFNASRQCWI